MKSTSRLRRSAHRVHAFYNRRCARPAFRPVAAPGLAPSRGPGRTGTGGLAAHARRSSACLLLSSLLSANPPKAAIDRGDRHASREAVRILRRDVRRVSCDLHGSRRLLPPAGRPPRERGSHSAAARLRPGVPDERGLHASGLGAAYRNVRRMRGRLRSLRGNMRDDAGRRTNGALRRGLPPLRGLVPPDGRWNEDRARRVAGTIAGSTRS